MHSHRFLTLAVSALVVTGCIPFRSQKTPKPVVEVTTTDANLNSRWHATIASPADLAGAVQMSGSASMTPGSNSGNTDVALNLANAAPGGVHPWQVRRGQCGADEGVFGPPEAYKSLRVDDKGRGSGLVTVPVAIPANGMYFVSVSASTANAETIVACGNLAPPTQ
jgi:hypothetical protein